MTILEFKLQTEEGLKLAKETDYNLKDFSIIGVINNEVTDGELTLDYQNKPSLILKSIGGGKLPTGSSFILVELEESPGHATSWEATLENIDQAMDEVPLNAPVLFSFKGEIVYSWSSIGGIGETPEGEHCALYVMQFFNSKSPLYRKIHHDAMTSLGVPRIKPPKGMDFFN